MTIVYQSDIGALPLIHEEMELFWIRLNDVVEIVVKAFQHMHCDDNFVPKIQSSSFSEIREAMSGKRDHKSICILTREKLHQIVVSEVMAHYSVEIDEQLLCLSLLFFDKPFEYTKNRWSQNEQPVPQNFECHLGTNPHFLSVDELNALESKTE